MEEVEVELDRVEEAAEEEEHHAMPIGVVIRVTGRGRGRKSFYESFEYDGNRYELNTSLLARRLLKGELDPSQILNMSPNELKEALTAEELASREPEEPEEPIQMTDACCKRCAEKKVRVMEIFQAGHGDRYSLECIACGNTWYASGNRTVGHC